MASGIKVLRNLPEQDASSVNQNEAIEYVYLRISDYLANSL